MVGMGNETAPIDIFGTPILEGSLVAYAVSQGQNSKLKIAVATKAPRQDDRGRWKLQIRHVYSPGAWRGELLLPTKTRKTTIDCSRRVLVLDMSEDQVREKAKVFDAVARLDKVVQ